MSNIDLLNGAAPKAVIFGVEDSVLSAAEAAFFAKAQPLGFILFARNAQEPAPIKQLVQALQRSVGRAAPILIDQEGGRVQRLKPPHWRQYPAAEELAAPDADLAGEMASLAGDLRALGINVNCAPVLDVRFRETHTALGNRIYSDDPAKVARCGTTVARAFLAQGVLPVIKHLPGLGRAHLDTHHDLPAVMATRAELDAVDFAAFRDVLHTVFAPALWGMVSHAIYSGLDPTKPASCSSIVIAEAIRGAIGFDGLLLSDDLSMGALNIVGDAPARAQAVLAAGCDIALHCNGNLAEMQEVTAQTPQMTDVAIMRYNRSIKALKGFAV